MYGCQYPARGHLDMENDLVLFPFNRAVISIDLSLVLLIQYNKRFTSSIPYLHISCSECLLCVAGVRVYAMNPLLIYNSVLTCFVFMPLLELCRCSSDFVLSNRARCSTGLATTYYYATEYDGFVAYSEERPRTHQKRYRNKGKTGQTWAESEKT